MLKVYGNWGAMAAVEEMVVKAIVDGVAKLVGADGAESFARVEEIRDARPEAGSPIGIYWNRRDAY